MTLDWTLECVKDWKHIKKHSESKPLSGHLTLWEVFTCNSNSNSVVFCIYSLFSLLFLNVLQKSLECSENIAIQILQRSCDMIFKFFVWYFLYVDNKHHSLRNCSF